MNKWTRANPLAAVPGYKVPRGHYANGYTNGGDRVGFRNGGPVDRHPPSEKEKRAQRQADYMKKHGPQKPRRKTLGVTDKYKKAREQRKFSEAGFKPLRAGKAKGGKAKDSVHQPGTHSWWLLNRNKRDKKAKGGKADKNWIQGVNKSIKARGTKGVCTGKKFGSASCKPGSKRYNLAKTFKKMARAKHASGGLVRYI